MVLRAGEKAHGVAQLLWFFAAELGNPIGEMDELRETHRYRRLAVLWDMKMEKVSIIYNYLFNYNYLIFFCISEVKNTVSSEVCFLYFEKHSVLLLLWLDTNKSRPFIVS